MGGKGGKKTAKKHSGGKRPPAAPSRPAWHVWLRYGTIAVLAIVASALFAPFNSLAPVVVIPLVAGAMAGMWARKPVAAAVIGAAAALAGCLAVLRVYKVESFVEWVQTRMPQYVVQDTTRDVFDFIIAVVSAHPLTAAAGSGQAVVLSGLVVLLAAAVAAGVALWLGSPSGKARASWAAWATVTVLAMSFAYTSWTGSAAFRTAISTEPVDKTYAYDAVFNVKTYYRMRAGEGFYDAYVYSLMHDSRQEALANIKGDKFISGSPMMFRPPAAFYLWRVAGAGSSDGVMMLSVLCCVAVLVGVYAALKGTASTRAVFVSAMLYPGLMLHTVWYNVWFPDWWAALAILGGALFLVSRRYWEAGALAFLATLFREASGFWILTLVIVAFVCWRRGGREWLARCASYLGGLLLAAGLFAWHTRSGQRFFLPRQSTFGLKDVFGLNLTERGIDFKLMAPTSYLMLPYGMYAFPVLLMMPAAAAGFWLALPAGSAERFVLTAYPLLMLAFYATVGATSSYWGQMVMPLCVMGTALLLARADATVARLITRGGGAVEVP